MVEASAKGKFKIINSNGRSKFNIEITIYAYCDDILKNSN